MKLSKTKYLLFLILSFSATNVSSQTFLLDCGINFEKLTDKNISTNGKAETSDDSKQLINSFKDAQDRWIACLLNKTLPKFSFLDISGNEINSDSLKEKILVIQFWSELCPPCMDEIPIINKLASTLKNENVVFITIANCNYRKVKSSTRFQSVFIPSSVEEISKFGVVAYPTILICSKGNIISKVYLGADRNKLESFSDELLSVITSEIKKK